MTQLCFLNSLATCASSHLIREARSVAVFPTAAVAFSQLPTGTLNSLVISIMPLAKLVSNN